MRINGLPNSGRIKASGHDQHHVVRHVATLVVVDQCLPVHLGKHIAMADDRLTIRMLAKRGFEQRLPQSLLGVIESHVDLTENDLLLPLDLVRRQS